MSMLAEPRRKQKIINLRAKNNAWSNDTNKFGQRMLEKMGWSAGKGLGVNENGIVEHVVARYKNDEKGLGYQDKNDQWTKHEDGFNALLASLTNSGDKHEKLHSGISLEDKSKKSKARVHYHKFTRAKDISQYSKKDLANIFGKKSFENSIKVEENTLKEDVKTTEQVFTEKGSMEDYFKSKLSAKKTKNQTENVHLTHSKDSDSENDIDYGFQGFAIGYANNEANTLSSTQFSFYNNSEQKNYAHADAQSEQNVVSNKKSKKRKLKNLEHIEENDTTDMNEQSSQVIHCNFENGQQDSNISKKEKKKEYALYNEETEFKKKKKDKNKDKSPNTDVDSKPDSLLNKPKKKKNKLKNFKT